MDSQWLNTQFDLNPEKTKAGLAEALGLGPPAISKILKGTRQIKAQEYAVMRRYFGLTVDGPQNTSLFKNSFVISPLDFDNGLKDSPMKQNDSEWVIPAGILNQRTAAAPDQIKIFQIKESTMEPDYRHGEHVLVDMSDQMPSPPGAFVVSDGFGHLVRHCEFLPGTQPPEVRVSALDKSFQPQNLKRDDFKIIGRIIAKLQMV